MSTRALSGSSMRDLSASLVVFLVALPLALGIAHASGAPLISGIICGIVGGLLVAWLSGSQLSVSGPAAGLVTLVMMALDDSSERFIGYQGLLLAIVLAGAMQMGLGLLRAGGIADYVSSNVIKGLLAAIGATLVLKQLPYALGTAPGDDVPGALGAPIVAAAGLAAIVAIDRSARLRSVRFIKQVPPPLWAVLIGLAGNAMFSLWRPSWTIGGAGLVHLPEGGPPALLGALASPDFGAITDVTVWSTAASIAAVASIETLLCLEAIDRLDPAKRVSPRDRELLAQGAGNIASGLLGGLPMTAVIVRGSANIQAGGRTRLSAFLHGVWLLLAVLLFAPVLGRIPVASLAVILLYVGYKLTRATLWRQMWALGWESFTPFAATFAAVLATDVLTGVAVGMGVEVLLILRRSAAPPAVYRAEITTGLSARSSFRLELPEHTSFLHKAPLSRTLAEIPGGALLELDARRCRDLDHDIEVMLDDFAAAAPSRDIEVHWRRRSSAPRSCGPRSRAPQCSAPRSRRVSVG